MGQTKIEWCDKVLNLTSGCSPISEGCAHCWAKRMANRLKGRYGYLRDDPFKVTIHPEKFIEPMSWRKHQKVFVCSMGDLFHDDVPSEIIQIAFDRMVFFNQHTYLILTKRPQRMVDEIEEWKNYCDQTGLSFPTPNMWLGVSVENQRTANERIPILLNIPAVKRFVSVEPMLGPIDLRWIDIQKDLNLSEIHWVICGGETGPKARPMHPDWIESIRDQCQNAAVPFFFKQWGEWLHEKQLGIKIIEDSINPNKLIQYGFEKVSHDVPLKTEGHRWPDGSYSLRVGKKKAGRMLDGRTWEERPK